MTDRQRKIWDAAELVHAGGMKPTNALVRKALGGGTFTDIAPVLRQWRDRQDALETEKLQLPPEITAALTTAARTIVSVTRKEVSAAVAAADAVRAQSNTKHQQQVREMEEEIASLEQDIDGSNREIQRLSQTAQDLEADLATARAEHKEEITRLNANVQLGIQIANELRKELDDANAQKGQLAIDLARAGAELRATNKEVHNKEGARLEALAKIDSLQSDLKAITKSRAQVHEELLAQRHREERINADLQAAQAAIESLTARLHASDQEALTNSQAAIRANEQASLLEKSLHRAEERNAALNETIASLQAELKTSKQAPRPPNRKNQKG